MTRRRLWHWAALIAVTLLVTASGFLAGFGHTWARIPRQASATLVDLGLVWEAWGYVNQYFYGATPEGMELTYGAIDGALSTLQDPYTRLVRPVASEIEQDSLRGRFGGIGAYVYEEEGGLYLQPFPGSPAEQAGVLDGDRLLEVDGKPLPDGTLSDVAVSWIRGEAGTEVRITVLRPSTAEKLIFTIMREELVQPTVEWSMLTGYDRPVGYLKVTLFGERTAEEVQRALASVRREGAAYLVLDLRGNPGGLLESAIEVSSRFLRNGVVVRERNARGEEKEYTVRPRVRVGEPLAVLIDGGSASASEIVAGALQDHGRAILVGSTTRGKGSVQFSYQLEDGSSLHVTSAVWLTPDSREINGVGLPPDVPIEPVPGDTDVVLDAAVRALGGLPRVQEAAE